MTGSDAPGKASESKERKIKMQRTILVFLTVTLSVAVVKADGYEDLQDAMKAYTYYDSEIRQEENDLAKIERKIRELQPEHALTTVISKAMANFNSKLENVVHWFNGLPKSYAETFDLQDQWMQEYYDYVIANLPGLENITDYESYNEEIRNIDLLIDGLPGDDELFRHENDFEYRYREARAQIDAFVVAYEVLQSTYDTLKKVEDTYDIAPEALMSMGKLVQSQLDVYFAMITWKDVFDRFVSHVNWHQEMRKSLPNEMKDEWTMIATDLLHASYQDAIDKRDESYRQLQARMLNDSISFKDVYLDLERRKKSIKETIQRKYCPLIALREIEKLGVAIEETANLITKPKAPNSLGGLSIAPWVINVIGSKNTTKNQSAKKPDGTLDISDEVREDIEFELERAETTYSVYKRQIQAMEDRHEQYYVGRRVAYADYYMQDEQMMENSFCQYLSEVVHEGEFSVRNETAYLEMVERCGK